MNHRFAVLLLCFCLSLNSPAPGFGASAEEETVQKQIEFTRERIQKHKAELSALYGQFAANPSAEVFSKTQLLQVNIQKERGILGNLDLAMRDARAASSWTAMLDDMAKESTLISAGATALYSVASAGKWIFGASQEDIFGESWQNAEHLNANLSNEAKSIIEESGAVRKALSQIQGKVDSGAAPADVEALQKELTDRLNQLNQRAAKVKEAMKFMVRVYKAEKQNLPASTVFWGEDFMGRYVDRMLKEIDSGAIVSMVWDLVEGRLDKVLIKLVKPMVKTAIGDYLAKSKGGSALTPQIIDDLVFSILFSSSGGGVQKGVTDKLKSKATGVLIEGTVKGIIEVEAQASFAKANVQAYGALKETLAAMPKDANFADKLAIQTATTEKLVKQQAHSIEYSARTKADQYVKAGKVIKDIWELALKDAVGAYLNSGTFTDAIKSANEACTGWRETYRKNKDDMIETEDEYVNSKWFSGGRTMPVGVPPKTEDADPSEVARDKFSKADPDAAVQTVEEVREDYKTPEAQKGGLTLGEVQSNEQQMFDMVLSGKMPPSGIIYADVQNLTIAKVSEPCTQMSREHSRVSNEASQRCEAIFHARPLSIPAWRACLNGLSVLWEAHNKAFKSCWQSNVVNSYNGYAQFRAGMLTQLFKKLDADHKRRLGMVREDLQPASSWAGSWESLVKGLQEVMGGLAGIGYFRELEPLPDLPAPAVQVPEVTYDVAKNKEVLEVIRKMADLAQRVDFEKIDKALSEADFTWEIPQWLWDPVFVYDQVTVNPNLNTNWTSVCGDWTTVMCSGQRAVEDTALTESIRKIYEANPDILQGLALNLGQYPPFAAKDYYKKLSAFSIDKALSLYQSALQAGSGAAGQSAEVSGLVAEMAQSAQLPPSVFGVLSLYEVFFQPWRLLRGMNPGLAANRLNRDTEAFKKELEELENKYQSEKRMAVQKDPATLEKGIEKLKSAYRDYGRAYDEYYAYLRDYFPDREFPYFEMPDLSGFEMQAYGARAGQEETAQKFKTAAKGLEEMKEGLKRMEQGDEQILRQFNEVEAKRQAVVQGLRAYWDAHKNDKDLGPAAKELEKAKKAYESISFDWAIPDHNLPKKIMAARMGAGGSDWFAKMQELEKEILEALQRKQEEQTYSNYQLTNPRLNSYDLKNAFGEVAILPEQLQQGKLVFGGWLSHIDGIDKMFFSEDGGGGSWREIPVQQSVQIEIVPAAGRPYKPVLRIKTKLSQEFTLPFFDNVQGIVFRDADFRKLVQDTVVQIANAYEQQNAGLFSDLIAGDYLGDKNFLAEGVRFDFEMFADIRLKIYINRIEKRSDLFVAETKWDKSQVPRKSGQEQKTSGQTTMMFVLEDGKMKIKNLRGNLIYATLSPQIAEASGLSQTVVEQIREAEVERNPVQPGAGTTLDDGGVTPESTGAPLQVRNGTMTDGGGLSGYDFTGNATVAAGGAGDVYLEINIIWTEAGVTMQQGGGSFSSLTTAPDSGYVAGNVSANVGSVHVFITREGYYGKMEVLTSDGVPGGTCTFRYAVQTDGSKNIRT
ncbi:MAG: hypothetical protein WC352_02505 [Candidatus Omnitrophota bacterium]|jgi:hypothetical protein